MQLEKFHELKALGYEYPALEALARIDELLGQLSADEQLEWKELIRSNRPSNYVLNGVISMAAETRDWLFRFLEADRFEPDEVLLALTQRESSKVVLGLLEREYGTQTDLDFSEVDEQ